MIYKLDLINNYIHYKNLGEVYIHISKFLKN